MEHNTAPVGLAIVGAGLMGSQHAASASLCPDIHLVGVTAHDAAQRDALAATHDVTAFVSIDDVLADERVEAVLIATPTDSHRAIAECVLEHGRHVFVEKPVARTLDDALAIKSAAASHDRVVGVGHVIRYFSEYRALAAAVRRGDIGVPAVATFGRRCQQPDWAPDQWHTNMQRSGGVAVDMLIHDVDLVRWMFGEPTHVYARVVGSDRHDGLDIALATLTIPDGPICHLHGSWAEPDGFSQSAEICGDRGMITYDSRGRDELRFTPHDAAATATALPPPPPGVADPFQRQLSDFARAIRHGDELPGDIDWAIGSLRIALAMLESNDQRDVIATDQIGTPELMVGSGQR